MLLCVRRCVHVIGQSHNRRGADCTLASWDGRRGRQHSSRLDKVVSNSGSALLVAYARWGEGVIDTTGRLDKLLETIDFYAKHEFSGDLGGLSRQH